jgi:hypothetical protein
MKDNSQRKVGKMSSQMHDELMPEWIAKPRSWDCRKCRDAVPVQYGEVGLAGHHRKI